MLLQKKLKQKPVNEASLRKLIEPKLGVQHPKFGYTPPPPPNGIRPVGGAYFELVRRRRRQALSLPRHKISDTLAAYRGVLDKLVKFTPFFDEYDVTQVIPTVTAMNVKKVSHSDLDEGAPLRLERTHVLDADIYKHVIQMWSTAMNHVRIDPKEMSLPTQTNLGWPFLFSQKDKLRPFTLGTIALAVQTSKDKKMTLKQVYDLMSSSFGQPMIFQGSRLQHTEKVIPFIDSGGFTWSQNFEPRYRAIFMGSKVGIVWNRLATKKLLKAAMSLPQHDQQRPVLKSKIQSWLKDKRYTVVATDVSKFDKAHGSQYLRYFAKAAADILKDPSVEGDFLAEVSMPMVIYSGADIYTTADEIAPQLPSGVSFTTGAGLFYGDYVCHFIAKKAGLNIRDRGGSWDFVNWGDDVVIRLPASVDKKKLYDSVTTELQIEISEEPVVRYLGFNYGSGSVSTAGGYSVGRMVLKQLLPERLKAYPFSLIGYLARLTFIPDPEKFHDFASRFAWSPDLGDPFPFVDRSKKLEQALKDSLDSDVFDSSALDFLLHGLEPTEASHLLDPLDIDFDFTSWLGHSFTDFSDPIKALKELDPTLFTESQVQLKQVKLGGFEAIPDFASWITGRWGLRRAGVIF